MAAHHCLIRDYAFDFRLTFESLLATLIESGELHGEKVDAARSRFTHDIRVFTPLAVALVRRRT